MRGRISSRLVMALALAALLLATFATSGQAYAGRALCRTDPVVVLNDGTIMEINTAVQTDIKNLGRIDYVLHVPQGVKPVLVLITDVVPRLDEHVSVIADQPTRTYKTETTIRTKNNTRVGATVNALYNAVTYGTANGFTFDKIPLNFGVGSRK